MPMLCDYILTANLIVTQNETRDVLEHGAIAVHGNRIVALDEQQTIQANWRATRHINLGESLIMPGLINAHTHAAMTLLRGIADDLPLMDWLTKHIFPVEQGLTSELVELGTTLACAEMARTGTTAFSDMYLLENAVVNAVDKAGMRCLAGECIFGFPSPAYDNVEKGFELVERLATQWKGHSRIRIAMTPHAVYTSNPDILTRCRDIAERLELPIHLHLAETPTETQQSLELFNARPVSYCDSLGLLTPKTTLAHCVDVTGEELALFAKRGVVIAHNPESNMKLASGVAPLPHMVQHGIPVALGTDGAASNNNLSMFTEMTSCALLHKVHTLNPTNAPAQRVLDMATRGGAAALHWDGIGSLEVGGIADIIALDLQSPNLMPLYKPISHIVYAATGHEVRFTMVDGTVVFHDGSYSCIDMEILRKELQQVRHWAQARCCH